MPEKAGIRPRILVSFALGVGSGPGLEGESVKMRALLSALLLAALFSANAAADVIISGTRTRQRASRFRMGRTVLTAARPANRTSGYFVNRRAIIRV